jgi:hypothetical protein
MTLLVDVPGVNVLRQLDRLSNDRDPAYHAATAAFSKINSMVGVESFKYGLPTCTDQLTPALEDYDDYVNNGTEINVGGDLDKSVHNTTHNHLPKQDRETHGFSTGRDVQATLKEVSNLAVGKLLEVNFERNGNKATVQVQMRLLTIDADSKSFVHILSQGGDQNSLKERYYRFKADELRLITAQRATP